MHLVSRLAMLIFAPHPPNIALLEGHLTQLPPCSGKAWCSAMAGKAGERGEMRIVDAHHIRALLLETGLCCHFL